MLLPVTHFIHQFGLAAVSPSLKHSLHHLKIAGVVALLLVEPVANPVDDSIAHVPCSFGDSFDYNSECQVNSSTRFQRRDLFQLLVGPECLKYAFMVGGKLFAKGHKHRIVVLPSVQLFLLAKLNDLLFHLTDLPMLIVGIIHEYLGLL